MKYKALNTALFVVVCIGIIVGWNWLEGEIWPKPKRLTRQESTELRQTVGALAILPSGIGIGDAAQIAANEQMRMSSPEDWLHVAKEAPVKPVPPPPTAPKPKPATPGARPEFIALSDDPSYYLQVRLTTRGGGVDRLILTHFPEADKYGLAVKNLDGSPRALHLIPSAEDRDEADREAMPHDLKLPSFLLHHYAGPKEDRPENDLGERLWQVDKERSDPNGETRTVTLFTDLPEFGVRFSKTYTLAPKDYHIGLTVSVTKLAGATVKPLRYSLSAGHGLPIEGEWYTSVYRNALTGWIEHGRAKRHMEDAASIHTWGGGDRQVRTPDKELQYVATALQYFTSALAVDDQQPKKNFIEFTRATAEGPTPALPQFGDIAPRMISEVLEAGERPIEHKYVLYHGPIKVRLLHQLEGDKAVASELVDRYEHALNLRTTTDYRSPGPIGAFANAIFWTDLTIASTNAMHAILGLLNRSLGVPWLAVVVLTVLVRALLMPFSRKQTANMQKLQDKMKELEPDIAKLKEQYKNDPQEFNRQKTKLMMERGANPLMAMGGCLLMFAQMPIFIGLYYSLQENVFFRLQKFLWIPNLAAPDMLVKWGESIPYISDPLSLGSLVYLGPYFNLLPVIAVALMVVQQKLMTPPAMDEQQEAQQKMMKWMMIVMGVIFYKVASALCLYFIVSTGWALLERKLFPKKKTPPDAMKPTDPRGGKPKGGKGKPSAPKGRIREMWDRMLEEAQKKNR